MGNVEQQEGQEEMVHEVEESVNQEIVLIEKSEQRAATSVELEFDSQV